MTLFKAKTRSLPYPARRPLLAVLGDPACVVHNQPFGSPPLPLPPQLKPDWACFRSASGFPSSALRTDPSLCAQGALLVGSGAQVELTVCSAKPSCRPMAPPTPHWLLVPPHNLHPRAGRTSWTDCPTAPRSPGAASGPCHCPAGEASLCLPRFSD